MEDKFYKTIKDYIKYKDIDIVSDINFNKNNSLNINEKMVENQICLLKRFHEKMQRADEKILERINNQTGKIVEGAKIDLKKINIFLDKLNKNGAKNEFEEIMLSDGKHIIELGEECIQKIYANGYIDSIVRSMDKGEICIGNSYFNNISESNGKLIVKDIKKVSYNIVETDAVYLFNKIKKKNLNLNFKRLICFFCHIEELNPKSQEMIRWLINYPSDFIKYCIKYISTRKTFNYENYKDKFKKSIVEAQKII